MTLTSTMGRIHMRASGFAIVLGAASLAMGLAATAQAKGTIVHDAEYNILAAQNGARWAGDDGAIDERLAASRKRATWNIGAVMNGCGPAGRPSRSCSTSIIGKLRVLNRSATSCTSGWIKRGGPRWLTNGCGNAMRIRNGGARFRISDGTCISGPCRGDALASVAIEVTGGEVRLVGY